MKLSFKYLSIVISLILTLISFPQSPNFLIQKYSVDQGLPDNRINDIAQDSLGRLWVAMKSGIAMYDGVNWIKFGEKDSVPEVEYSRIKIDDKGTIWFVPIRLNNEINFIIYREKSILHKMILGGVNFTRVPTIGSIDVKYNKNKPVIIIGTLNIGILKFENGGWYHYIKSNGLQSDSTTDVKFKNDNIYVSSIKGLSIINKNHSIKNYNFRQYKINPKIWRMTFFTSQGDKEKLLLFGSNWIGEFTNEQLNLISSNFHFPSMRINDLYTIKVHPSGDIFFGNSSKIFLYDSNTKRLMPILFDEPSTNKGANSIYFDYEGNIWAVGTRGIYKLIYSPFQNYSKQNGLLEDEVSAISEFNSGQLVFGHNYGLTIKTKSKYKYIINGIPNRMEKLVRVLDIYHDTDHDKIYFCSIEKGIGKLSPNGNVDWIKGPLIDEYWTIFKGNDNKIMIYTFLGLGSIYNNKFELLSPSIPRLIRKGLFVNDSATYFATDNGLVCWNTKKFYFTRNSNPDANNLYNLFYNKKYGLLVGSVKGLYKLQKDFLIKFKFNDQEINESVYFIIEDKQNNIWVGTNNGVLRWDGKNLNRYNKSDGLAGNETNRAAGFVDSNGNVWIGTDEGVSMYTGKELDYSKIKTKLILLDVQDNNNVKYSLTSNINFDPDNNSLSFNYRGLSFIDETQNVYQVKLSQIKGNWQNEFETNYSYSRFNNLPPGDYIFNVRVKNSKGFWSDWKSSSIITINEHYYQQPLFIIGIIFLALFIFYYVYEYLQQKKYTFRLEKAVEVRTKLLRQKQSELVTSLERYKGIVESQTDLVIRFDATNNITFVNDAFCSVSGKSKEDLIGNSNFTFIHPDDREATSEEMEKLKLPPHRTKIEKRTLTINGYRWFLWESYGIYDENQQIKEVQSVGRDITLQKEIEEELEKRVRERTEELRSLVSQSPLGIMTFDEEGFLIDYNDAANKLFKNLNNEFVAQKTFNIYDDEFLLRNGYKERFTNLNSSKGLLITNRLLIDNSNNEIYKNLFSRYLIYRIYRVEYEDKSKNLILLLEDVTDLQKTEEESKKVSEEKVRITTFIKTVEAERERISKELHDGIGQLLTTAKLKLDIFRLKTNIDGTEINEALNILLNAGEEIRRIINDLRPSDIDNFGLISAIELLCDRIKQVSGLNIQFSFYNYKDLYNKKRENLVYRIIQEALNNLVKHSNCKNAGVTIIGSEKSLKIEIWDDGKGFDQNIPEEQITGFGISNMKERTNLLGGTIIFSTSIGKGLKIIINIPLKDNV